MQDHPHVTNKDWGANIECLIYIYTAHISKYIFIQYLCIFMYKCVYIYIHLYAYIYLHIHTHIYTHTYIHTYIHRHIQRLLYCTMGSCAQGRPLGYLQVHWPLSWWPSRHLRCRAHRSDLWELPKIRVYTRRNLALMRG